MDNDALFALIAAERLRAADMFESLDEAQWETSSLCSDWRVGDIAGHLIAPFSVSLPRFIVGIITSGGFDSYNSKASRQLGARPRADIAATLRANADNRFTPPGLGPLAPLTDLAVHVRDAARPLGLDVSAPPATWEIALGFLASAKAKRSFVPGGRLEGLSLRATDSDWRFGQGPEVAGPGEALGLAATGRRVAVADLTGDGVEILAKRLG